MKYQFLVGLLWCGTVVGGEVRCVHQDEILAESSASRLSYWEKVKGVSLSSNHGKKLATDTKLKSSVKSTWDKKNLNVLFLFEDYQIEQLAVEAKPNLWAQKNPEIAEMIIDPQGSKTNYFEINLSPEGIMNNYRVQWSEGRNRPTWTALGEEGIRKVSGKLNRQEDGIDGWFVQVSFPWSFLGCTPKKGEAWLANFHRIDSDLNQLYLSCWPTLTGFFHVPEHFGKLIFD